MPEYPTPHELVDPEPASPLALYPTIFRPSEIRGCRSAIDAGCQFEGGVAVQGVIVPDPTEVGVVPRHADRQGAWPGSSPFWMNTIECCDGMSNRFPHVLQMTESSTRIM